MLQFTLSSCFNLAGCNLVQSEAGVQSRQVRRRKFGIICPYFAIDETEQVSGGIEVTVDHRAAMRAGVGTVTECEVITLMAADVARLAAGIEAVGDLQTDTVHRCLVLYLPSQFAKGHVADTLGQTAALHTLHIQVLDGNSLVGRSENGRKLLCEVTTDGSDVTLFTSEAAGEFYVVVRPLHALQTLLLGFRMLALGELAAQSGYLSLMVAQGARVMDGDTVGEHHSLLQSEVDADGSVLLAFGFGMSAAVFLFGYLHLEGCKELVTLLRDLHAQHLAVEAKPFSHLHIAEVRDVHVLTLAADVVGDVLQMLQSLVRVGEFGLVGSNVETALAILLLMRLGIVGTMLEEVSVGRLQVVEGMSRGILRHLVGERELLAANGIEIVAQLAPAQSALAFLVPSLPLRQAPVVGQPAAAYRLSEIGLLLVVGHQLDAVGDGNHSRALYFDIIFYCFLDILQQLLVLVATASIEAGREYGDDFEHILGEFLLKPDVLFALVDDDHLDMLGLADGEHQFCTEAQQSVFVRQHQSLHLAVENQIEQPRESLLIVVHAASEVLYYLVGVALAGAVGFKHGYLPHKILFLVVRRNTGVGYRPALLNLYDGILVEVAQRVNAVAAVSATGMLVRMEHPVLVPVTHRSRGNSESLGSFAYGEKFLHDGKGTENISNLQGIALNFYNIL